MREGAPLQPPNKLSIEAPHDNRAAGEKPQNGRPVPENSHDIHDGSVIGLSTASSPPLGEQVLEG